MLSFVLTNILLVPSLITGHVPCSQQEIKIENQQHQVQSMTVDSTASIVASRDTVSVIDAPKTVLASAVKSVPLGASNSSLVSSAMKYLGSHWDCTYLVEQSLRDLGYQVSDLAPMQFGQFGTVFYDPSQVQAGDIMMRGGHVAIYAGDGYSVQGGFGFGGVVYNQWEGPANYSAFVRIG